jgi:tetratricopeptide (TPR) repeat protein
MGDDERAMDDYYEAVDIDPNNKWAYFKIGDLYYAHEFYDDAEENYEEALRLDPNNSAYKAALERARKETEPPPMPPPPPGWR